jgi:large repetitive protein
MLLWLVGTPAVAAPPTDQDAFLSSSARAKLTTAERAELRDAAEPGTEVQLERRLGVPTILWAAEAAPGGGPPRRAARRHLERLAPVYRLAGSDVDSAKVASVHDTGRGGIIVTLRQTVGGVPVYREEANVLMTRDLGLVGVSGYLAPVDSLVAPFTLDARDAVASAAGDLLGRAVAPDTLEVTGHNGPYVVFDAEALSAARATRVMYRLPGGLEPAYYVEVHARAGDQHFAYVVGAGDGRILSRQNLETHAAFGYRVWADTGAPHLPLDGPHAGVGFPHPTGVLDAFEPPFAGPSLVSLQNGPISTNDPWLPSDATETVGNNVDSYADLFAPSGFQSANGDIRAASTSPGLFDRTYNTAAGAKVSVAQTQAAITQAFYTTNFLHDWFYDSGFDEESANAQDDNFGRGGLEGDSMNVEVQDFAGLNNANMFSPADGSSPRMQLFIFSGPVTDSLTVNSPASIDGEYPTGLASFGPTNFDLTGDLVLVNDGQGTTTDGCDAMSGLTGLIAVIDRGTCTFERKVKNAQDAGASGALIVNNLAGSTPPSIPGDGMITPDPTIPALSLTQADGNTIKVALTEGAVNATLLRSTEPDRDGAIDNTLIAHEWAHYMNQRLIGDLSPVQAAGMNEGWADFVALLMAVRPEDVAGGAAGVYPVFAYSFHGPRPSSYYFGGRRIPYSTDFTKNALTFKHISDGEALPAGVPTASTGIPNSEVHNTGEVWATMLWEVYAALLEDTLGATPRLTFAQAQLRMRDYLVAAHKLTPAGPTFIEARDALLLAAAANDQEDAVTFWEAFARRGAGTGAVAPDRGSLDNTGVTESFVTGGSLEIVSATLEDDVQSCDSGDGSVDNRERGLLRISLYNDGARQLENTTIAVSSDNPNVTIPDDEVAVPATDPFETVEVTTEVGLTGASQVEEIDLDIEADDDDLDPGGPVTGGLTVLGNARTALASSADDDVSSPESSWSPEKAIGTADWTRATSFGPFTAHWHGPDAGHRTDTSLVSPPLAAGAGPVSFTFKHRFAFESSGGSDFDGGVIEVSSDGGSTWVDADTVGDTNYTGTITDTSGNPLANRFAYTGTSAGHPSFNTQTVDLGTTFAGQTIRVRFRVGTDAAAAGGGWDVDDLSLTGLTNTPFHRLVADAGCPEGLANLSATPGLELVSLDWDDAADATGYEVFRRNPDRTYPSAPTATPSSSAFTDSGRAPGTQYCYKARGVNIDGAGPMSSEVCATAQGAPPGAVGGFTATPQPGAVSLDWGDVAGADSYFVFRRNPGGGYPVLPTAAVSASQHTDGGRAAGVEECYRVQASGQWGTGPLSGEACATPVAEADSIAPAISRIALAASRFRAAPAGATVAAAPVGTRVSYRLSEAAAVTLRYETKTTGRRVGGRCRPATRRNRSRPRCVRWTPLRGSAALSGNQGTNSFRLTGRLRGRKLRPAQYRLQLSAADAAGNTGLARSAAFRIVRK